MALPALPSLPGQKLALPALPVKWLICEWNERKIWHFWSFFDKSRSKNLGNRKFQKICGNFDTIFTTLVITRLKSIKTFKKWRHLCRLEFWNWRFLRFPVWKIYWKKMALPKKIKFQKLKTGYVLYVFFVLFKCLNQTNLSFTVLFIYHNFCFWIQFHLYPNFTKSSRQR